MKSSSYYSRKAEASRERGHWAIADSWAAKAAKARRIEKLRRHAVLETAPDFAAFRAARCADPLGRAVVECLHPSDGT